MRDVVIVGGGLAGLVAGCRASELGMSVLILEQGSDSDYLCNSRVCGGVFAFAGESLMEPPELLAEKAMQITDGFVDHHLIGTLAADARRALEWLSAQKIRFGRISPAPRHQWVLAPLRILRPGLDPSGWKGRAGDAMLGNLTAALKKNGGEILLGTKAAGLVFDGDHCIGVNAINSGHVKRYDGKAVLLADGGFQANDELVGRFISKTPDRVRRRNAGTGNGDAIRMLEEAGARLVGMKYFYGHLLSRDAMQRDELWPYPGLDSIATAGIVVMSDGRRLFDEGLGGVYISNAVAWSDDPLDAWVIFDEEIWNGPGRVEMFRSGANPGLIDAKGTMYKAPTLSALEQQAGFATGAIQRTVSAYNEAVQSATLETLQPRRSTRFFKPMPIHKAPFYAVPMCTGLTTTMGGAAVDESMRALRDDNSVIPGLFVAGKTCGGLEGGEPVGYVGGLSLGLITGLRAAEGVAAMLEGTGSLQRIAGT